MAFDGVREVNRYTSWTREVASEPAPRKKRSHSSARHGERGGSSGARGGRGDASRAGENIAAPAWQLVHEQLLSIAQRRGALDAHRAVDAALASLDREAPLDAVLREALKRCHRPDSR